MLTWLRGSASACTGMGLVFVSIPIPCGACMCAPSMLRLVPICHCGRVLAAWVIQPQGHVRKAVQDSFCCGCLSLFFFCLCWFFWWVVWCLVVFCVFLVC